VNYFIFRFAENKIIHTTFYYAGLHSLIASRPAKQQAGHWFGDRQRNGLYRVFYIIQSAITLAGTLYLVFGSIHFLF
jgi:hypothetical protein